jgi:trehalose 6-phosphate phosphatase
LIALFVDLDGTLIDVAPSPDTVVVPPDLAPTLLGVERALGGAFAVVSGRRLDAIDRLLAPFSAAAGLHGGEVRLPGGALERAPVPPAMELVRARVAARFAHIAGVLVEDKGLSVAVHFRRAPAQASGVHEALLELVTPYSDRLRVLPGKMVFEVMPRGFRKDAAIATLMARRPFQGRRPIFIGDDRGDEEAIAEAMRRGGVGWRVGEGGTGRGFDFDEPLAVRQWLAGLVARAARHGAGSR